MSHFRRVSGDRSALGRTLDTLISPAVAGFPESALVRTGSMGTADHAGRFFDELSALHEAAGRPTLEYLVRRCGQRGIAVSDSTVSGWLTGASVPSRKSQRACIEIVRVMQEMALQRDAGFGNRPEGWWQGLLGKAREERAEKRGGRPSRPKEAASGPMTLPADAPDFTGRDDALRQLTDWLSSDGPVSVITGMGGAGKTALAVHAAHRVRRGFPGGILFADLRGYSSETPWEAGATAEHLLRALGKPKPPATPEQAVGLWRTTLERQERPLLVVLDNVATAGQISALIPGPPHRLLVTSRNTLSALPGPRVDVAPFDAESSVALLGRALRRTDPADERVAARPDDARRLAELCGHLPLALHIVAALLRDDPDLPLAVQADELTEARDRLDRLRYDDVDERGRPLAVRAAFDLSYRRLDAAQARAFRLLGAMPGADTALAAASAVIDRPDTARLLADLTRLHLLRRHRGGRWDMHDLIRLYAAETAAPADHTAALDRILEYYGAAGKTADLPWLDAEYRNLAAAVAAAHRDARWEETIALATSLQRYWEFRERVREWIDTGTLALDAAEHLDNPEGIGAASGMLGNAYRTARQYDESMLHLRRALETAPDRAARGRAHHNLGLTFFRKGDYAEAETCHRVDLAICRKGGDEFGAAHALTALGDALRKREKHVEAAAALQEAIEMLRLLGRPDVELHARTNLALTLMDWRPGLYGSCGVWHLCHALRLAGELDDRHREAGIHLNMSALFLQICPACHARNAVRCATRAIECYERLDDTFGLARSLLNLGRAQWAMGDPAAARRTLERAASVDSAAVANLLDLPYDEVPAHVPGCWGRTRRSRMTWLDDLPDAVLRGDHEQLDRIEFIDFRYAVHHPSGYSRRRR